MHDESLLLRARIVQLEALLRRVCRNVHPQLIEEIKRVIKYTEEMDVPSNEPPEAA